jgi:hypothetical protein
VIRARPYGGVLAEATIENEKEPGGDSMSEERRYDDAEIAEIIARATESESSVSPVPSHDDSGLTLTQIQEIGSEVGISPARIAVAARSLANRGLAVQPLTFFGAPRSVTRIVQLERALNDDEWDRLVVDVRETFRAIGHIRVHGQLRTWNNGNLQVHAEPDGDGYRVRMTTSRSDTMPYFAIGLMFLVIAAMMFFDSGEQSTVLAAIFAVAGAGQIAFTRQRLPRWARERAAQMEGLAERIPLLMERNEPRDKSPSNE